MRAPSSRRSVSAEAGAARAQPATAAGAEVITQAATGAQTNPTAAEGTRSSSAAAAAARRRRWEHRCSRWRTVAAAGDSERTGNARGRVVQDGQRRVHPPERRRGLHQLREGRAHVELQSTEAAAAAAPAPSAAPQRRPPTSARTPPTAPAPGRPSPPSFPAPSPPPAPWPSAPRYSSRRRRRLSCRRRARQTSQRCKGSEWLQMERNVCSCTSTAESDGASVVAGASVAGLGLSTTAAVVVTVCFRRRQRTMLDMSCTVVSTSEHAAMRGSWPTTLSAAEGSRGCHHGRGIST